MEHAVGEGVLAVCRRRPRQLAQPGLADHGVVVLAEVALDLLDRPRQPDGLLAVGLLHALAGVAEPLGGLARLVQQVLALVGVLGGVGRLQAATQALVVLAHPFPDHCLRGFLGTVGPRWSDGELVEPVEQGEVAVGTEHLEQPLPGPGMLGVELRTHALPGRRVDDPTLVVEPGEQPRPHHLGVTDPTERVGQPLQLGPDLVALLADEERAERRQGVAQPADRDPHLVHAVRSVPPRERVAGQQLGDLPLQPGLDDRGRRVVPGDGGADRLGRRRNPVAEHERQLRGPPGRARPRVDQPVPHRVEERRVPLDQLGLPLPPGDGFVAGACSLSFHTVVADLRQGPTVAIEQQVCRTTRADGRDRCDGLSPDVGDQQLTQALRGGPDRPAQRLVDLLASLARRELEVPPGVGAACAPAQDDAGRGQVEVGRVEVRRLQRRRPGPAQANDSGKPFQRWQRGLAVDGVLGLDLLVVRRHRPPWPPSSRVILADVPRTGQTESGYDARAQRGTRRARRGRAADARATREQLRHRVVGTRRPRPRRRPRHLAPVLGGSTARSGRLAGGHERRRRARRRDPARLPCVAPVGCPGVLGHVGRGRPGAPTTARGGCRPARLGRGPVAGVRRSGPVRGGGGGVAARRGGRRLLERPGRRRADGAGGDGPGLVEHLGDQRRLRRAAGLPQPAQAGERGRSRGPRHGVRAARRRAVPGPPDGDHRRHGAHPFPLGARRQSRAARVDAEAAGDHPGEPDGDPARRDRRDPRVPVVRPREPGRDGGQPARRRGAHRGDPEHRTRAAGRRRRQHQQPVHRRRRLGEPRR